MPKPGRPKMAKAVRKGELLAIRVSESEKREITRAARHVGAGGASAWTRMVALREARKINEEASS
jgi:uncharacterized protein (DUF1778 family)